MIRPLELCMIDEVSIMYDVYQLTSDYIATQVGYDTWLSMQEF